jgi:hypothetical protein
MPADEGADCSARLSEMLAKQQNAIKPIDASVVLSRRMADSLVNSKTQK